MNLEGVVYFYRSIYSAVFEQISQGFTPAEQAIESLLQKPIDSALESVLKK